MTQLATRAEITKLARTLDLENSRLDFLDAIPADQLRTLREAVYERLFGMDLRLFTRAATFVRWLPPWLTTFLAQYLFGPMLTARVAGEMPARRAAQIGIRASTGFLADVCMHLDPRCARDLIRELPVHRIVDIALEVIRRQDFITMGRFVDYLSDDAIRALIGRIEDDGILVRAAYYMESKNRLDHVVRMMPRERLRQAILLVLDSARDIMTEVMSLIIHVSYALQRELGDLAAAQDEAVLDRIVHFVQERQLWADLLPVVLLMSEDSQRKVVNLPILRNEPTVLESIIRTAHEHELWGAVLPLVPMMNEDMINKVAEVAAQQPRLAMQQAATAALMGERWEALLDVVVRMPRLKQLELAEIVQDYGEVDPELASRLAQRAGSLGFSAGFLTRAGA